MNSIKQKEQPRRTEQARNFSLTPHESISAGTAVTKSLGKTMSPYDPLSHRPNKIEIRTLDTALEEFHPFYARFLYLSAQLTIRNIPSQTYHT